MYLPGEKNSFGAKRKAPFTGQATKTDTSPFHRFVAKAPATFKAAALFATKPMPTPHDRR